MKKSFNILAAVSLVVLSMTPAYAQFTPPGHKSGGVKASKPQTKRPMTLAEQQKAWAIEATKVAVSKIDVLPLTANVNVSVQNAVTNYAPNTGFGAGYAQDWTSDDCERSIRHAEQKFNLPPYLLAAIALTESGMGGKPSPFALNISGKSYYAQNTIEMKNMISRSGGEKASIDVGCLQINLRWHSARFKDWQSLLVPNYNAEYAALYLTELHKKYGTWNLAVGAYHSRTPWRSQNYACLVSRRWSQIFGSDKAGCGADIEAMARYMYQTQRS